MWPDFFWEAGALVTRQSLGPTRECCRSKTSQIGSNAPVREPTRLIAMVMAAMPMHDDGRRRCGVGTAVGAVVGSGWPVTAGIHGVARPVIVAIGARIILGTIAGVFDHRLRPRRAAAKCCQQHGAHRRITDHGWSPPRFHQK